MCINRRPNREDDSQHLRVVVVVPNKPSFPTFLDIINKSYHEPTDSNKIIKITAQKPDKVTFDNLLAPRCFRLQIRWTNQTYLIDQCLLVAAQAGQSLYDSSDD